jgi:serine/threonine protein phosphatase PrpC
MATTLTRRWLSVGAATDIGCVRRRNEDALHAEPATSAAVAEKGWLGVVADGVGGRPAGHVASELAIRTIVDAYYHSASVEDPRERLLDAVRQANAAVLHRGCGDAAESGMATTVTAAALWPSRLLIAHVGDGRAYLLRRGALTRLTHDHRLLVAHGQTSRNAITRALGIRDDVDVDVSDLSIRAADVVMLCTDGLHATLVDSEIRRALRSRPEAAAHALVARANDAGGPDNVSVVVTMVAAPPVRDVLGHLLARLRRLGSGVFSGQLNPYYSE